VEQLPCPDGFVIDSDDPLKHAHEQINFWMVWPRYRFLSATSNSILLWKLPLAEPNVAGREKQCASASKTNFTGGR
jgi:hypothetical protein